ncbi:hypothetical protein BSKO_13404 [Bryopsis sp. KO-2023]|nr:hypothetical protein BSKO_13404 [Bryopsis sp. KO-2023]
MFLGCVLDREDGSICLTKNGAFLEKKFNKVNSGRLWPAIGLRSACERKASRLRIEISMTDSCAQFPQKELTHRWVVFFSLGWPAIKSIALSYRWRKFWSGAMKVVSFWHCNCLECRSFN